jgi:hypothetical protein
VRHRQRASATPAACISLYFPENHEGQTAGRPPPACRAFARKRRDANEKSARAASLTSRRSAVDNRTEQDENRLPLQPCFAKHFARAIVNVSPCAPDRSRCRFSCPRPACGERAQWSVRESEWVRGRDTRPPSPIVARGSTELPSPRKRGEGTIMATESAARRRTVFRHSHLTMSNSPDLLVPAARFCARVLPLNLHSPRIEGWAERRRAHLVVVVAPVKARVSRVRETRRASCERCMTRSPFGAPPWLRPSVHSRASGNPGLGPRLRGPRDASVAGCPSRGRTEEGYATSPLRLRIISGNALNERGCESL